ncbi:MAG: iron-sulfur cluster repair di-iron protein [Ignavibacteriaceae bacterium]
MVIENNDMKIDNVKNLTLSQLVKDDFHAAAVLEKYHLDFCCRGNRLLSDACKEKGLDSSSILFEINNINSSAANKEMKFDQWELDFLIDYIINNHHKYIRQSGPVINAHIEKVAAVHGKNHPETIETAKLFLIIHKDLKQHLMKEEEILFPYIKYLVRVKNENAPLEKPYFSTIANPIKMMETEHQSAGDIFSQIRKLTNDFGLPADACSTYNISFKELNEFELDLHRHIHLENNILFPKSIELERNIFNKQ